MKIPEDAYISVAQKLLEELPHVSWKPQLHPQVAVVELD